MNVVIDGGNSSLKVGWFEGPTPARTARYVSPDALVADLSGAPPAHVLVSSTSRPTDALRAQLQTLTDSVWGLDGQTPVPIGRDYETPHTLGTDRVAAAVGATALYPAQDALVLDLGTCLTADWVDQTGTFRGGLIAPGLTMRLRAMHEQTARLPLVRADDATDWPELTARSTQQAMLSGVLNGLAFELNGIIQTYRQHRPELVVLLCGGDAPVFESRLKAPIFVVPELVLIGLNRILAYNVELIRAHAPDTNG